MKKTAFWKNLESRSWPDLIHEKWGNYQPPLTVHLPIHPAESADFVHIGPALEATRRRVFAGLDSTVKEDKAMPGKQETLLVQFALNQPPSVPDFRRSRFTLENDSDPVAHAEYFTLEGLLHDFEYFCCAVPGEPNQSLLWVRGAITNLKGESQTAHVRIKVGFPREAEFSDYHYRPYFWDAGKLESPPGVSLQGSYILRHEQQVGKVNRGEFAMDWVSYAEFPDADYEALDPRHRPNSSLRCHQMRDVIHLHKELQPNERQEFSMVLLVNFEDASDNALQNVEYSKSRSVALEHFHQLAPSSAAQIQCDAGEWTQLFRHLPISILQLMPRFEGRPGLLPTQGGTSERHFVWVGECVFMLMPLLKLGYFVPVRAALEYIFSFQDSGSAPHGRLATTKGAIGTSGPKWLNTTGNALALAAEYFRYSHDEKFLSEFLPRIVRAMDWIVGELRATRQLNPDGTRPLWFGLMPFGRATDGDTGYVIGYTDAYTFWGLEKTVALLEEIDHERAAAFRQELECYRADIASALETLAQPDGFIPRKIVTGDSEEKFHVPFDRIAGAFHLALGNALDVQSPLFARYVDWFESTQGDDLFSGRMDYDMVYIGVPEWAWQNIYLQRGEWKKAFAAAQINFKYGKSQDAHQVQERFRPTDPAYCPWQPNGSGNGRMLDMMLNSFYFEQDETAILLPGIPFAWLADNKTTELKQLHTPRGILSLRAVMQSDGCCHISLEADTPKALPRRVRFPSFFRVIADSGNSEVDQVYVTPDDVPRVDFTLLSM